MSENLATVLIMGVALALSVLGAWAGYAQGYRDGQVVAINGTIKYELVVQKDGSSVWREKK